MNKPIFKKSDGTVKNIMKSININRVYYTILLCSSFILGVLNRNITCAFLTLCGLYIWMYFTHILAHNIFPFKWFHKFHHHEPKDQRWYDNVIETSVNIFGSGGISLLLANVVITKLYHVRLLDNHMIIFIALLYTTTHMINYHFYKVPTHIQHHVNTNTNFGPDLMDILFGTKSDGDEIENMDNGIFNLIVILFIVVVLKCIRKCGPVNNY